jgi:hypothetical protein
LAHLHSPVDRFSSSLLSVKRGLPICPVEKRAPKLSCSVVSMLISGSLTREKARKAGVSWRIREQFSELQTSWRRERDSNPYTLFRLTVLQQQFSATKLSHCLSPNAFRIALEFHLTHDTGAHWELGLRRRGLSRLLGGRDRSTVVWQSIAEYAAGTLWQDTPPRAD